MQSTYRQRIHKGNEFNLFPFLYASFVKAPAGRALEEVARLVVTEGLIFHKNMEFLLLHFYEKALLMGVNRAKVNIFVGALTFLCLICGRESRSFLYHLCHYP